MSITADGPAKDPLITDDWHVSTRIYRDPSIFARELVTVFHRTWVFVAHETEIPEPGDYRTAYLGRQPVIVNRSADTGRINVMFNRCRHRGSQVCQRETGNANFFRCAYHGWTYSSSGELTGVPFDDGYAEFDKSAMGLVHVPRVESYRGFVFASLDAAVPPLPDYLGNARRYLDFIADIGDGGPELVSRAHKLVYRGNWKLQIENTIDPYHFSFTHKSWLDILKDRTGKSSPWVKNVRTNPDWRGIDLGNGHAVHEYGRLEDAGENAHAIAIGELIPFNLNIFPSLAFVGAHLRLVVPRSVDETWVYLYPLLPRGADAETRARILRDHEIFYGPAGFGSTDDIEVGFDRVTQGNEASASAADFTLMARGLHREVVDEETGVRIGRSSDEVPQRAYLRRWLELMEAGA
ncbi:Rieske 2Fe-2S domain-containing protein [Amycolatopsis rubida]|uniref:Rieske 2Fe-2S domain-containing protein n=2 Tax=Amycolatopsis TaxID=1813 RepID=A0ABX0BN84_9PSEU|nr:Rieske 2Fe-2S domain-containing protein [Amycolatopsis rubida]MYW92110.1 Rieske 2Fe-2S domain-containing protein [Amycolatopsis rubida]NEC57096.1 Rieske 2Fe-2S domain-containing protein [Amycolatopsis rubida]